MTAESPISPGQNDDLTHGDLLGFLHDFQTPEVAEAPRSPSGPAQSFPPERPTAQAVAAPQPVAAPLPPAAPQPVAAPQPATQPSPAWNTPNGPPQTTWDASTPLGSAWQSGPAAIAPYPYQQAVPAPKNTMASVALGLGIGSVIVPLLTIPGLILGAKALGRAKRQPWLGGRERSIAAIVTSLILGPVVAIVLGIAVAHALTHENMGRVKSLIASTVQTSYQQQGQPVPNISVQCPASEPRRTGTVFSCVVTNTDNDRSIIVTVRESDSQGDILVTAP